PAAATPAVSTPPPAPAEEKTVATVTPSGTQIWVCPQLDGTPTIIETATPPQGNCQPLGRKGGETSAPALPAPNRGKPLVGFTPGDGEEIAQDIYKCFDNEGTPNFVPANKREHYRHCTFFSRSYSGAKQEFRQQATQSQSLEALAAAGVQKNANPATNGGPGLQCTGAGSIAFNGETREFNCATRSFDYTPGTSGGEARLGNQQTNIAAHNLDYLNTQGSCGGTVTSENGRVFHLEPTKDCPQSYVIEAERLAAKIRNELNINVSGAFRERQRNLSAQINQIAAEVGIEPHFVHAIISAESAYKPGARSHAGAMGLMQLMPGTARRFGVTDAYNTGQNITGGATYLKWLLNEFGGDMQLAAAGYNAGEGNVKKYGNKTPPFIETRAYVPKVMEYYRRYKANPSEIGL
ncbi:lytic transglycosylase domain-containing protein, partial [Cardiobacterium hominis]|uniref:lytic transglycosylase domain-containing protein n=1 Tax=Cardiobacterium hominis TaxID=2718 RepID=UPI001178BBF8